MAYANMMAFPLKETLHMYDKAKTLVRIAC